KLMKSKSEKYEQGFIVDPYVMSPTNIVADVLRIKSDQGFSGIPITDSGKMGGKLVGPGNLSRYRLSWRVQYSTPIREVMTPLSELITAPAGVTLSQAHDVLQKSKKANYQS
ncbi:hypothetical protein BOX15_Mlig005240g2, partial [Macrostomum lignano]